MRTLFRIACLLTVWTVVACKIDVSGLTDEGRLLSITLDGPSQVQVGDTIRLSAYGKVSGLVGLLFIDRLLDGKFTASDPNLVSIQPFYPPSTDTTSTSSVLVTGRTVGSVEVTVTARGKKGMHPVQVIPAVVP